MRPRHNGRSEALGIAQQREAISPTAVRTASRIAFLSLPRCAQNSSSGIRAAGLCACGMEIIIASRVGQLVGRPRGFRRWESRRNSGVRVLMKAIAKGAQSAWTKWERGFFLRVRDWFGRVGGRRGTRGGTSLSGGCLACGSLMWRFSWSEGEKSKQPQPSSSRLESIRSFAATRLRCHGLQIGE